MKGCKNKADYEIYSDEGFETHACREHLTELLTDSYRHTIYDAPENAYCCALI